MRAADYASTSCIAVLAAGCPRESRVLACVDVEALVRWSLCGAGGRAGRKTPDAGAGAGQRRCWRERVLRQDDCAERDPRAEDRVKQDPQAAFRPQSARAPEGDEIGEFALPLIPVEEGVGRGPSLCHFSDRRVHDPRGEAVDRVALSRRPRFA